MKNFTNCTKCNSENIYSDANMWICPECGHEWSVFTKDEVEDLKPDDNLIKDANGNVLQDGDTVTVIKDLKIKGSSSVVKVGTKVKNIKLNVNGADGHDISCKIEGFGAMNLKSEFVRKA
jgi:protein PhnA